MVTTFMGMILLCVHIAREPFSPGKLNAVIQCNLLLACCFFLFCFVLFFFVCFFRALSYEAIS